MLRWAYLISFPERHHVRYSTHCQFTGLFLDWRLDLLVNAVNSRLEIRRHREHIRVSEILFRHNYRLINIRLVLVAIWLNGLIGTRLLISLTGLLNNIGILLLIVSLYPSLAFDHDRIELSLTVYPMERHPMSYNMGSGLRWLYATFLPRCNYGCMRHSFNFKLETVTDQPSRDVLGPATLVIVFLDYLLWRYLVLFFVLIAKLLALNCSLRPIFESSSVGRMTTDLNTLAFLMPISSIPVSRLTSLLNLVQEIWFIDLIDNLLKIRRLFCGVNWSLLEIITHYSLLQPLLILLYCLHLLFWLLYHRITAEPDRLISAAETVRHILAQENMLLIRLLLVVALATVA